MPYFRRRFRRRAPRRRTAISRFRRANTVNERRNNAVIPRSVSSYRGEMTIRRVRYAIGNTGGYATTMTSSSGALASTYVLRANDLYDPDFTNTGHQARGFDQIIAMFRNFCVLGSKIVTYWGYGQGSATSYDMNCSVILKDGTTAMSNAQDIMEHPRVRSRILTAEVGDRLRIVHKYSWRINSIRNPLDNDKLWGTSAQSPTEGWYYHLNAYTNDGTSSETASVSGYIDFTVAFFHAQQPSAS